MATARPIPRTVDDYPGRAEVSHDIYWRTTEPVAPTAPLREDVECDICFVGGGYTAMWAAHFLKIADPSLEIHIVEADYAGAGASGHNDGFITPTIGHDLNTLVKRYGAAKAKVAYAVVGRSILEIGRFCARYGVDADYEPSGYFQVATTDAQVKLLRRDIGSARRLDPDSQLALITGEALQNSIDSPAIRAAIKGSGALINPHRLARGLARVVQEQGVHIHEQTAAQRITSASGTHRVHTPFADVSARKLVLATNAYQHQFSRFRHQVAPVWSYAAVTEPLTDEQLRQVNWPGREGFVEARNFIVFGRLTADNRLLFGGGPVNYHWQRNMDTRKHIDNPSTTQVLREVLHRYFPSWSEVPFSHAYGGCVGITRDFVPHVGHLGNNIYYGYGYCGNGIAVTHTTGRILRDLILGRESTYTGLLFVNGAEPAFPPEPLTYLGSKAKTSFLQLQDRFPKLMTKGLS